MIDPSSFFAIIAPIIILPYILMMIFIISYLGYRKYQVNIELRNLPSYTTPQINLAKVKLNLEIQVLVFNFLLVLSILELIADILGVTNISVEVFVPQNSSNLGHLNDSISSEILDDVVERMYYYLIIIGDSGVILQGLLLPIITLLVIVLRRAYLNAPYKQWIVGYTVYILARLIILFFLRILIHPQEFSTILVFPIALFDSSIYLPCCRRFYLLLKGMREEARWHSTHRDYRRKQLIVRQFFYTQIFTISCYILVMIDLACLSYQSLLSSYPWFFYKHRLFSLLDDFSSWMNMIALVALQCLLTFSALMVCLGIFMKLVKKNTKSYNPTEDKVLRSLMRRYRAKFETPYMRF